MKTFFEFLKKKMFTICVMVLAMVITIFSNQQYNTKYYYCELCGAKFSSISDLTSNRCFRGNGKHKLYEGEEKSIYICEFYGRKFPMIKELTSNHCMRNPSGDRHSPAL